MTITTTLTAWCEHVRPGSDNSCQFWQYSNHVKRSKVVKEMKEHGWTMYKGELICPECTAYHKKNPPTA